MFISKVSDCDCHLYLDKVREVFSLVGEEFFGDTISKRDQSVWEVVLSQPRNNSSLLHVWPPGDVDYQISMFLPMPEREIQKHFIEQTHFMEQYVLGLHGSFQNASEVLGKGLKATNVV